jgi:hypothetical protein
MKPKKISEFLAEEIPGVDLPYAQQVITAYKKYWSVYQSSFCAICDKPLSEKERMEMSERHFNWCCNEHAKYRTAFQTQIIRDSLGIEGSQWLIDM